MKKIIAIVGLTLFAVWSTQLLQTPDRALADEGKATSDEAPEVITTITNEDEQKDRVRPEYLQPTPVAKKPAPTAVPIEPREGETIVFLGNTLAARMEHYNFFETTLHQQFPEKQITFRNMGFPGHTPAFRPEAGSEDPWAFPGAQKFRPDIKGHFGTGHYPSPDEWLTIVKANTIVAFFGFNESFDGEQGVANFKNELSAFVDHTRSRSYSRGGQAPRLVLATPIAMQQHPDYFLPDAGARNALLKKYADVVRAVANEKQVGFVDLFTPTEAWFRETNAPLTINGVHLSAEGYQKLAPVLMQQLFGDKVQVAADESLLHKAVQDKAWFWRNDYRMLNGVHAYGRRWAPYGNTTTRKRSRRSAR